MVKHVVLLFLALLLWQIVGNKNTAIYSKGNQIHFKHFVYIKMCMFGRIRYTYMKGCNEWVHIFLYLPERQLFFCVYCIYTV